MTLAGHTDAWNTSLHSYFLSLRFHFPPISFYRCSVSLLPGPFVPSPSFPQVGMSARESSDPPMGEKAYFYSILHNILLLLPLLLGLPSAHIPLCGCRCLTQRISSFYHFPHNNSLYRLWESSPLAFLTGNLHSTY